MKLWHKVVLIFFTFLSLAGCSATPSSSLSNKEASPASSLSDKEACQEAMRLMGKGTDIFMKAIDNPDAASSNFTTLAFEFGQLIQKTNDKSLKEILVQMQSGLKTMANEATFFEGNSIYSNQITPLTQKCYGR